MSLIYGRMSLNYANMEEEEVAVSCRDGAYSRLNLPERICLDTRDVMVFLDVYINRVT